MLDVLNNARSWQIHVGDVREGLRLLPDNAFHCVITSPPYWGLRNYGTLPQVWGGDPGCQHEFAATIEPDGCGSKESFRRDRKAGRKRGGLQPGFCRCGAWSGSLGLEPSPDLFVRNVVDVFREVRRVLRPDGVCFVNMGDSFWTKPHGTGATFDPKYPEGRNRSESNGGNRRPPTGAKPLDMVGIPWMLAFALRADGWFLRSDIIWSKGNPMPESVNGMRWVRCKKKTGKGATGGITKQGENPNRIVAGLNERYHYGQGASYEPCPGCEKCAHNNGWVLKRAAWRPTKSHEYIFMLTKTGRYFCDTEAVKEECQSGESDLRKMEEQQDRIRGKYLQSSDSRLKASGTTNIGQKRAVGSPGGRNPRSVWNINTAHFPGAHFATFPPALVEKMLRAGTSEYGCCPHCQAPFARKIEKERIPTHPGKKTKTNGRTSLEMGNRDPQRHVTDTQTVGWLPTCGCNPTEEIPCVVLDPFAGACTSLLVARRLQLRAVGIELNPEYAEMGRRRVIDDAPLLNS